MPKTSRGNNNNSNSYVRFGALPESERSINYTKLNSNQADAIQEMIEYGRTPEQALKYATEYLSEFRKVNPDDVLEKGVSVFKADKNGMPVLDNMQQAQSLAMRTDFDMYKVKGKEIGKGQDGEPLLKNTKGTKTNFDKTNMENHIIKTLSKNFSEVTGKKDLSLSNQIFQFFSDSGEERYVYKGLEFKKPKNKKWRM